MRVFLSRDCDKILLPVSNSVDEMWSVFADLLSEAVECFVPKTFVSHKKHRSVQPFGYEIKESVRNNIDYGPDILKHGIPRFCMSTAKCEIK